MTIEEIKAKLPEADIYSLSPEFRYIIVTERRSVSARDALAMGEYIQNMTGHAPVIVQVIDKAHAIGLLEIKP